MIGMTFDLRRFSINTATLGYQAPLSDSIEAVARAGFGGISPWRREVENENVRALASQIRAAGLQVSGYCRSTYFPGSSKREWLANVDDNRKALRFAAELGAECFVLVVGGLPPGSRSLPDARQQVVDGIAALLADAQALDVSLAIEPLHPMYAADRACVNTIEQALDLCALLDPQAKGGLGVAIDVYHTWWDPKIHEMIARTASEGRLLAFHVNDWLATTADMLMDRGLPGEGVIDLGALTDSALNAGYGGLFELEVFSNRIWRLSASEILELSSRACLSMTTPKEALPNSPA
jgi:sugar phosphate isomerase/epimerase